MKDSYSTDINVHFNDLLNLQIVDLAIIFLSIDISLSYFVTAHLDFLTFKVITNITCIEFYVGYNLQPWNIRHITIGHKISNIIPKVHFEILGKLSHHVSLKLYPSYKDMMDPITSIHCEKGYGKFILWNVCPLPHIYIMHTKGSKYQAVLSIVLHLKLAIASVSDDGC